jgi:L-iditol 2-dehydrogenase
MPHPGSPGPGQVLIRSKAVGICGSDLHTYQDGRIGTTELKSPLVLGHEFAGIVEVVGHNSLDGNHQPLKQKTPVAVDPAQACGRCEQCEIGNPNLCLNIKFCGLSPDDGALRELMIVPANTCFPIPKEMDFGEAALLEILGVGVHAVDLAKIRVGDSVAIIGAGPIGLSILQIAKLNGATPIFITDKLPWRLELAKKLGATMTFNADTDNPVEAIMKETKGRGVDVAIEAAWCDQTVQQCVDLARNGGRLVLVGIPGGTDDFTMKHSVARRKGLTIRMARRMKHVYPRAIALHLRGAVDLKSMISHRFPLEKTAEAFAMNLRYAEGVQKIVIDV